MASGISSRPDKAPARGKPAVSAATATASAASAGVPMANATRARTSADAVEREQQRGRDRGEQQQGREGQPVAEDFGPGDGFLGEAAQRELIEHAVGAVRLDQALDRQQGGGQSGDPQRPAADASEQAGVGADGERHDRRDEQEEGDRQPGGARRARGGFRGRRARLSCAEVQRTPRAGQRAVRRGKDRAARAAMLGDGGIEAGEAIGVEAVGRLVEQPQRRARGDDPGEAGAARLAGRQETDRHVGERGQAHRVERLGWRRSVEPGPEAERPAQRQLAVERERVVGERQRRSDRRPARRAEQAGGEADQARLAAAVGTGDEQRLPRGKRQVEAFEQQPPAADAGDPVEAQQRASRAALERVHVVVAQTEMMADFVDQYVVDEMLETFGSCRPFVEDRAAVESDAVGQVPECSTLLSPIGRP